MPENNERMARRRLHVLDNQPEENHHEQRNGHANGCGSSNGHANAGLVSTVSTLGYYLCEDGRGDRGDGAGYLSRTRRYCGPDKATVPIAWLPVALTARQGCQGSRDLMSPACTIT